MRNDIWYTMGQIKFNVVYTSLLYEHKKHIAKIFNISIITLSVIGALFSKIWDVIPIIACIIIAIISLLKEFKGELVYSDKQFSSLNEIQSFYSEQLNKIEQLWRNFERGDIDIKSIEDRFYAIKEREDSKILLNVNENVTSNNKRLEKKAKLVCDIYFQTHYNTSKP